ncbi:MAG: MotA/TolQ/ExbB proton channel family protein [Elusimicrobiota bacterium]
MPTTIFGIIIGVGLMVWSIIGVSTQDPSKIKSVGDMYINLPSFLLVMGGTIAATLVAHPMSHLVRGFIAFFVVFTRREFNFIKVIDEICEFSQINIQKSIPGLEEKLKTYKSENLIRDGINMAINGYKPEEIMQFLELSVQRRYDREMIDYYVFRTMGRTAPAFGMVGTLVGLIFMLRIMSESPDKIGPFLALALITTFYGLILAHLIFNPMGNKVQHQAELNFRIGKMEIEGVMYILKKQHPIYIRDQLSGYVPPRQREKLLKLKEEKP